jgi:hypothetical protein
MNIPEEIEAILLHIAAMDEQLKVLRSSIRTVEIDVTLDVVGAKDDRGKPVLGNEKLREAAIAKTLADDERYANLAREVSTVEQERLKFQAKLERLRMEFKLQLLEAEQRNYIAAMKVADAIFYARTANGDLVKIQYESQAEVELPF